MSNNVQLSTIENGKTFKISDVEFVKFSDIDGVTTAVAKDIVFKSRFGDDNNFSTSDVLDKLNKEFLPKIAEIVGEDNICDIETDLTTLDGLKPYGTLTSKISLPTLDFYRANVEIFDKYKPDCWWWLATPESAEPHDSPRWIVCVSPSGVIHYGNCSYDDCGVRPFLRFISSISVSL